MHVCVYLFSFTYTLLLYSNADINIGFQKGEYAFNESDGAILDTVTLIKDRPSEQMFIVTVIVQLQSRTSYRDATAEEDFTVGTVDQRINLQFGPEMDRLAVAFEIFAPRVCCLSVRPSVRPSIRPSICPFRMHDLQGLVIAQPGRNIAI